MTLANAKINMLTQQLRTNDVLDERVLSLYASLDRKNFLPEAYQAFAYSDMQIPLSENARALTPTEESKILQELAIQPHETVLEVCTGTGFLTALLAKSAKKVITVDSCSEIQKQAKQRLDARDITNVEYITADGSRGLIEKAPYDVMVFTGGLKAILDIHKHQLMPNGRIFAIEGPRTAMKGVYLRLDTHGQWHKKVLFSTDAPYINPNDGKETFEF